MPYVTDTQLGSISDLSTGLPTTELLPSDWVVVAQVALPAGSILDWKMAMLKLYRFAAVPSGLPAILTPAGTPQIGVAFAFITDRYNGSVDMSLLLTGFNLGPCPRVDLASLAVLSSAALPSQISVQVPLFGGPKTYTVIVVNNTLTSSLSLALTGQLRVTQP